MKTRIIQTKFWADGFVSSLTPLEKIIFLYYLTNDKVNIIHCYECPDRYVLLDTGVSREVLQRCKEKLQASNKVRFYKDFVLLVNSDKYESYKGLDNDTARQKLLDEMSDDVLDWYNNKNNTPVDSSLERGDATLTINKKLEIINHKSENSVDYLKNFPIEDFSDIEATEKQIRLEAEKALNWLQANNKKKSNYKAFLRNWVLKVYKKRVVVEVQPQEPDEISEEQRLKNIARIAGMKKSLMERTNNAN